MNYLISQYPVTHDYLERLSKISDAPMESMVVTTITARGYLAVLKSFRNLESDSLYIPAIDSSAQPLLAPLQILSMFARARSRFIVDPDMSLKAFGLFDVFTCCLRMSWGFFEGIFEAFRIWWQLGSLLKASRSLALNSHYDKIIYLNSNLWLGIQAGGAVSHISGVIKGFLNKGSAISLSSVEAPVALPENSELTFNPVRPCRTYVIPRDLNHYRHNELFYESLSPLFRGPVGLIYQRMSLGNFSGVMLSRRHGVPLVLEYNGSEQWLANNWGTPLALEKLAMRAEDTCLKHAHLVVTVSDVLRDELIRRGVEPERIVSHSNGVDTTQFDSKRFTKTDIVELRKCYGISSSALVVTFVGTFGPWHGAEIFAQSIAEMAAAESAWLKENKLHFMFIGDGVRRKVVETLIADENVSRFVTISGLIDQEHTPLHLAASDILVSPHVHNPDGSPFFGSPTKLFEYLASGRPVVASDLGQISEVLNDCPHVSVLNDRKGESLSTGACGILVQPGVTEDLATAIKLLVENPEWHKLMGSNARGLALERYTWDHHVAAVLKGFERVRVLDAAASAPQVRLLFNGLHSKSGGGLTYLHNILPIMAQDGGIKVHLCVHEDQRDLLPVNMNNITVHYLKFKQGFWNLQLREQTDIPRLAKKIGADVTFSPANYGPLWAPKTVILLRNALNVAFVERRLTKLGYWALVYLGTFLSLMMSRRAIAVSEYARRAASGGLLGFFGNRFTVIPHGVSNIFLPPNKGVRRENFLLAVSDLYVQKNFKNLISAMACLVSDHPGLTLKIAGWPIDEEYFLELKQAVAEQNLERKVEFLGGLPPENIADLYRRCCIFVFPSTVETFGNPLVEAMASGAPIASSNTAAMPEVVGDAAEFFDPRDVSSIAAAIDRLLKDSTLREILSRRALKRTKKFSWQRTAKQTLAMIKEAAVS